MARRHPRCVTEKHAVAFDKMVELNGGDTVAAMDAYMENNYTPSDEANALVGGDVIENPFTLEARESDVDTSVLGRKEAVDKVNALLTAKVKKLSRITEESHPGLIKGKEELEEILKKIDEATQEEILSDFIVAAHNMTKTAEGWMDKFEDGTKVPTLENLKRIEEYIAPFIMLKQLSSKMFTTEEGQKAFESVTELVGRQELLRNTYLDHIRSILAEHMAPNYNEIVRLYEKNAERDFNKYKKKFVPKAEVPQARREYIDNFIASKAEEINKITKNRIEGMMMQVIDISQLKAEIVNPKDLNHPIMDMAVKVLDEADMKVWNTMESIVDTTEALNEAFVAHVGKQGNVKKQYSVFLIEEDGEVTAELMNPDHPGYKDFRDKYQDTPAIWNMHMHLIEMAVAKDKLVYKAGRLRYRLPFIEQTNLERIYDRGMISAIKDGTLDQFKLRGKDAELGTITESDLANEALKEKNAIEQKVLINESGDERTMVPLHYRNSSIQGEDQSFDVMRVMVLDYQNSLRFKEKLEVATVLLTLKDVVHSADIKHQTSFMRKNKINKETGKQHTTAEKSVLEDALNSLIRHRLYGISTEGDPKNAKMYQAVGKYTSMVTMAANHVSGAVNVIHGTTMAWIEAAAGNKKYFTTKDLAKAAKTYAKNTAGFVADMGERTPKNKINLMMRRFNAFSEMEMINGKSFAQNNKAKKLADSSAYMAFNQTGEHMMMTQVALASLSNVKVKDANGNYLDSEFKPTTKRKDAIGIDDAMIMEDGLRFHGAVASTEITNGVGISDLTTISKHIRRISRDLYGNYDSANKSKIQRSAAGAMLLQMRGWLVSGYQKRYKGATQIRTEIGEEYSLDRIDQLAYNPEINEFEEGQYITALRFIGRTAKELKALGIMAGPEVWNRMDDTQKANVRKTLLEAGSAILFFMAALAAEDDPDDPDDMHNIYLAYTMMRVASELGAFANPNDALRTFKSPAIAISTVENAFNTVLQVASPFELYEGGRHSGENKLWRQFQKLVPVVKQYSRNMEDSYQWIKN